MYYEENFQCDIDINQMDAVSVVYLSEDGRGFPSHSHSYYELRYNEKGEYIIDLNERRIYIPEDSLVFIPPLTIHSFHEEGYPATFLQIQFIPKMLGVSHLAKMVPVVFPSGDLAKNGYLPVPKESLLQKILDSMISYVPSAELTKEHLDCDITSEDFTPRIRLQQCTDIFRLITLLVQENQVEFDYVDRKTTMYGEFQKLLEYILNNPEKEMTAREAADFMHMSYYDFSRNFTRKCGISYIHMVNRIKIQRAKDLLNNTDLSVTDIASALDYSSVSYFNQVFRKYAGSAPLAYREGKTRHIS